MTPESATPPSADDALLAQLDGLSPAKRAYVEQRLREARARQSAAGIPCGSEGERAPLSPAQELLWRLEQAEPGTSTYNVPRALRIDGPLDIARLRHALDGVLARHTVLRSVFVEEGGEPVQRAVAATPVSLDVVDLSALAPDARKVELERALRAAAMAPFDLSRDPLLRATLLRTAADEHSLVIVSHHIASDGASGGLLLRDLIAYYEGSESALPPLAVQYADFARWQRAQLTAARTSALLAYWRGRLAGAPARLELPTDRPRPAVPSFDGARRSLMLPPSLVRAVQECARANRATPFVVLLAAYQALLHRYSRQDDIVVGTVVTGRGRPELEGLVGYFSNTLPLRSTFEPEVTFADTMARVRDASLDANEHADLPYETLALELRDAKSGGQSALFDTMFAMVDESGALPSLGGASLTPIAIDRGVSKFDLSLAPALLPEGLRVVIEYRTDLFDGDTIDRMLGHYGVLLDAAVRAPETAVSRLPLLTPGERAQVLTEWNATAVEYAADGTLVSLLAAQAARTPDAIAVALAPVVGEAGGTVQASGAARTELSYAELDARATVLARALVARGVTPGTLVGVCLERSLELVVALVAIVRAGGAYVPLDPEYPEDRIAFMLADARCPVLLTQARIAATTFATRVGDAAPAVAVLALDRDWDAIVASGAGAALPEVTPDDLAYMIYTSGSTGQPKGALNRHRGIVNRLLWMQDAYQLTPGDVVLQKTPFSFDVSVWEFFWPLMTGARLVLAEPGGHRDPRYLTATISRAAVTVLHFVPSMLRAFLEEPTAAGCTSLRAVMASGEALPYELQERFFATLPGAALHNLYGPTECAVDVSYWACRRGDARHVVPIGRPVANTQLYVLDAHLAPVPVGVAGELYLGGVQVGAGYWGRPELTAERFVDDPFSAAPNARLYRTGDLARWLPDGVVEYLGRLDFQVKLRGFRIELGEIEAALASHDDVRETVVVARDDLPGGQALIAYYSIRGSKSPTAAELRAHLRESLPDYMVPAAFVELPTLPLSPAGKIDRKALPAPADLAPPEREYVAPRTPTERQIAAIWSEVLRVDAVSAQDDFFDIGGHSLLAMRVVGRIQAATGVRVSFREMFAARTVERLAARVDDANGAARTEPTRIPRLEGDIAPMSYSQELMWALQRATPDLAAYNIAENWIVRGPLDAPALARALSALVSRHDAFRTTFGEESGRPVQCIGAPRSVPVEMIDLTGAGAMEVEARARMIARAPFDLASDTLLRAALLRIRTDEHLLVLVSHHIVYDGWSRALVHQDLAALYDAERSGIAVQLPPVPVRFADFSAWQREQLSGARLEEELAYWRSHLAGDVVLDLPVDHPRTATPSFDGARQTVIFPPELLRGLEGVARAHDVTLYVVLLAGFQALLHRYSGQQDIVVATVAAARERPELESVVGYFASTLALRTSMRDDPSVAELLRRVREVQLESADHATVPIEMLAGGAHARPLPNVMFVLQNTAPTALRLGDAELQPTAIDAGTAKFDLFLSLGEMPTGLRAALQYRTELFDDETATRMLGHLRVLLEAIVRDQDARVSSLPLLTSTERRELLEIWNDTRADFPRDATMHGLVAAQARATPDRLAVTDGRTAYTYAELSGRAALLARALRVRGITPGSFVGVCMDRSSDMVVAMLAVLEAGGAYVPLDPEYPEDRIAFMLEDTGAPVVITHASALERLPALRRLADTHGITLVSLDADWQQRLEAEPVVIVPDAADATASDLGYIIYTSGSTGRPKGVMIEHRNAVALITWARGVFTADELSSVLASTSICFDLSVFEIFVPLASGGSVVVVANALSVASLPAGVSVSLINSVPSAAAELVRLGAIPASVRTINLAGEPLAQRLVEALYETPTLDRVYDLYGPSEDTTYSTYTLRTRGGRASIGRPIANTQCYVLDARGQLVPVGVAGELFISGAGLARGYLNRDDLTAERFVRNHLSDDPSARMYRTGDRVRYLRDGRLEYLGRLDNQIKLRGFRIELGEIEAVLLADAAVEQAAAIVREVAPGDARLIAYAAPKPGMTLDVARLKGSLRSMLPQYMLPSAIVELAALPLTQNGKIDRKALPEPPAELLQGERYEAPVGEVETVIASVLAEILGRPTMGRDTNFFEAGGHSLLATRAIVRVSSLLRTRLTIRTFFANATVRELACAVTSAEEKAGHTLAVARAVLKLRGMSAADRSRLAATQAARAKDNS